MKKHLFTQYAAVSILTLSLGLSGCLQQPSGSPQQDAPSLNTPLDLTDPGPAPAQEESEETQTISEPQAPRGDSLKIHAFSDMNVDTNGTYSSHTQSIVQQMVRKQPAAILGLGDFIDGEKTGLSDSKYVSMWNAFTKKVFSTIELAGIPFLPTPGNHDAYYNQEREIFQDYWNTYKPDVEYVDDRNYPFYYSFVKNGVFFVSLDDANYSRLSQRTAQLTWLKEQLSSPIAQSSKAKVVYGHIPLYSIVTTKANSSTIYENGVLKSERKTNGSFTLEAILLSQGVDLVIFGHSHGFYSGHYVYPDGKKLRVISLPCAGGSQRYLVGTSIKTPHGFVEIEVSDSKQIDVRYINSAGTLQSLNALPSALTLDAKNKITYEKVKTLQ